MKRKYRKYIVAVVFLRRKDPQFLILHRKKNWKGWELPKGGLIECEKELKCLKREIREETGLKKINIIAKTRHLVKYPFHHFRCDNVQHYNYPYKQNDRYRQHTIIFVLYKIRNHNILNPALERFPVYRFVVSAMLLTLEIIVCLDVHFYIAPV